MPRSRPTRSRSQGVCHDLVPDRLVGRRPCCYSIAGGAQRRRRQYDIMRDLASRVGPVIGSAQALPRHCPPAHPDHRRQVLAGDPGGLVERGGRSDLTQVFDRSVARQDAPPISSGRIDCIRRRPSACRSRTLDLRTPSPSVFPACRLPPLRPRRSPPRADRAGQHGRAAGARHRPNAKSASVSPRPSPAPTRSWAAR